MFYYILRNLFPKNNTKSKIYIVGSLLYMTLYSFINSSYVDNYDLVIKYRKFIYHIMIFDLIVTYFCTEGKKEKKRKTNKFCAPPFFIEQSPFFSTYPMFPGSSPFCSPKINQQNTCPYSNSNQNPQPKSNPEPNQDTKPKNDNETEKLSVYKENESDLPVYEAN